MARAMTPQPRGTGAQPGVGVRSALLALASGRERTISFGYFIDRLAGSEVQADGANNPALKNDLRQRALRVGGGLNELFTTHHKPSRDRLLEDTGALRWSMASRWRVTLHLARATGMENAGMSVHPVYGFPYMPGSGLKGLARAYAETVWLLEQSNPTAARGRIIEVFGNERPTHGRELRSEVCSAGAVVFHEAWPQSWPRIELDIVNPHYGPYYSGNEVPGDWHSPVPSTFFALAAGTVFDFAVGARMGVSTGPEQVELARSWLTGGLRELGAGAKTAAGYGYFVTPEERAEQVREAAERDRAQPGSPTTAPPVARVAKPEGVEEWTTEQALSWLREPGSAMRAVIQTVGPDGRPQAALTVSGSPRRGTQKVVNTKSAKPELCAGAVIAVEKAKGAGAVAFGKWVAWVADVAAVQKALHG